MVSRSCCCACVSTEGRNLDRLSRNKGDIKNELQYFKDNGLCRQAGMMEDATWHTRAAVNAT